ncbi:hypothetical protein GLOIN_2v1471919 [Rhizophagus irregularis DAOM 181602=DAOM 197198]|nr:hypothetical protein GLOIN_2v1471919 [Rhizophagus irregularis DAOM 181602=DAOM 197198]
MVQITIKLLAATLSNELQVDFNVIRCGTHSITFVVNVVLELTEVIDVSLNFSVISSKDCYLSSLMV